MLWLGNGDHHLALTIRDDISPEELRRRARRESDGRVAARRFAIANNDLRIAPMPIYNSGTEVGITCAAMNSDG